MSTTTTAPSVPQVLPAPDDAVAFRRAGAGCLLAAVACMLAGAITWATTGVDFDTAVETGTATTLLADVDANRGALQVAFLLWICATPFFAAAGGLLGRAFRDRPAGVAAGSLMVFGSAIALLAFVGFETMTTAMAPLHASVSHELATTVGHVTSRLDWIATIAIVGVPPALLSAINRQEWPRWISAVGFLAPVAALLTVTAMVTGSGLATYGVVLVPVGLLWSAAAGIRMLRSAA
ncbi:MAG TPA: hypothetical protein VMM13_14730 [Euzebya sp.]|nr:hypothetical protein [Euzebya sp.]